MAHTTAVTACIHTNAETLISARAFPPVPGRPGFTSIDIGPSASLFVSDEETALALIAAARAAFENARVWALAESLAPKNA